jgi:hypothetical protein
MKLKHASLLQKSKSEKKSVYAESIQRTFTDENPRRLCRLQKQVKSISSDFEPSPVLLPARINRN